MQNTSLIFDVPINTTQNCRTRVAGFKIYVYIQIQKKDHVMQSCSNQNLYTISSITLHSQQAQIHTRKHDFTEPVAIDIMYAMLK